MDFFLFALRAITRAPPSGNTYLRSAHESAGSPKPKPGTRSRGERDSTLRELSSLSPARIKEKPRERKRIVASVKKKRQKGRRGEARVVGAPRNGGGGKTGRRGRMDSKGRKGGRGKVGCELRNAIRDVPYLSPASLAKPCHRGAY